MALVAGGSYGGQTTTQQPVYASNQGLSSLMGLGMLGMGAYNTFGGGA